MSKLKKIPKSLVFLLIFFISLIFITYSYKVQNLQRLSQRIDKLSHQIFKVLPPYLDSMQDFVANKPFLEQKNCNSIKDDIVALQSFDFDSIYDNQENMDTFRGLMNDYYEHIQACQPHIEAYVQTNKEIKQQWKSLEVDSKTVFLNLHILSAHISELNKALTDGGEMYVNVLFLNMESLPKMNLNYYSDSPNER